LPTAAAVPGVGLQIDVDVVAGVVAVGIHGVHGDVEVRILVGIGTGPMADADLRLRRNPVAAQDGE
jgi:hypothetical protein